MSGKRGRPSKLTEKLQERLFHHIENGLPYETACRVSGIGSSTFRLWRQRGREHAKGKYHDFLVKCEQAEAKGEEKLLKVIMETALKGNRVKEVTERLDVQNGKVLERRTTQRTEHSDCRSAMFMLEKRYPERYGRQQKLEHAMPGGGALKVEMVFDDGNVESAKKKSPNEAGDDDE